LFTSTLAFTQHRAFGSDLEDLRQQKNREQVWLFLISNLSVRLMNCLFCLVTESVW